MRPYLPWGRALRSRAVWFCLLVTLVMGLVSAFATRLAPHDPYRANLARSRLPPMWVQNATTPGDADYPLGTDRFGRDILSRLLYGTRTAFLLALMAVPLAAAAGTAAGLAAGFAGGRYDSLFLLAVDILQSLPGIMFMVIIVLIFRSLLTPTWFHGLVTLAVGFAATGWVGLARLVRISVLQLKSRLFVEAAISIGAPRGRILTHHLLPNVRHIILVWFINTIPAVILMEAVLGYIGIGVTPDVEGGEFTVVSWGGMFFSGRSALSRNPLMLIIPSLCILLLSMSFIMLADYLDGLSRRE